MARRIASMLWIAVAALASCRPEVEPRPNVILITLDTTRADFFGCYGSDRDATPNFDRLAAEGTRFALAMTASAVTPVSHASILTGLNPYQHGLRVMAADGGFRLPDDVPTLATVLKDRGYSTAAIHSAFPVSGHFGFKRGFDHFDSFDDVQMVTRGDRETWDILAGQRRSDDTTDRVLRYLDRTSEPFFLWIHYWDPHDPLVVPPTAEIPRGIPRGPGGRYAPGSAIYAAELRYLDQQFGRVVEDLRARGRYDDTLFVVTSDHGQGLEDGQELHGWFKHRELYREQMHVPLIVAGPAVAGARVVEDLVRTIDIYPTVLDLIDVPDPATVEGESLRPLIQGETGPPRVAYADQINFFDADATMLANRPQADFIHCLMDRDWKLIYRPNHPELSELFHLREDPVERHNVSAEHPAEVERLLTALARHDGWVLEPFEMEGGGTSDATRDILASLGYLASGSSDAPSPMWEWTCPRDGTRSDHREVCTECGTPPVVVRRGD